LVAIVFLSACSPTPNTAKASSTATQIVKETLQIPSATSLPQNQNNCLTEKSWSSESLWDGTIIVGNTQDQKIYLLSSGDEKPRTLSGKNPTWDPDFRLSPDGKWLAYSILSDDGLSFTALRVRSLNGDQVWEIPYPPGWYSERYWINNEYIEILKSEAGKNTTNPYTGIVILNPFTGDKAVDMDFDTTNLNLKITEAPRYDPTLTRMIYLRDDLIPETGEAVLESIVVTEINSGKELWTRVSLGKDLLNAAWSQDGKMVAIQDFSELIVINLYDGWDKILQREGLRLHPSTFPAWSPDGRHIALKTYDSLAIYNPVDDVLTDYCLHNQILGFNWSPDGQQLAVDSSLSDGSEEILVINVADNTAVRFLDYRLLGWSLVPPKR